MKNLAKVLSAAALCTMVGVSVAKAETVVLQDSDRDVIREYVYDSYKGCPPGTVTTETKRLFGLMHPYHNCVIPKGATVSFYQPGTTLPSTVTYTQLPTTVTTRLPAPPAGDIYVTSGSGVYLLDPSSRRVVDTINIY